MASLCKKQQCTIDRRGFRQELDSWRHKLLHCVGFESILEGLVGPELVEQLKEFKDLKNVTVSDWSFDENCLFCCLRRDKVKEHLFRSNKDRLEDPPKPLLVKDQIQIIRLEKQAEEFLNAVLCKQDVPNFSDPHIPVVAREILQRMISQFAAEYTSKTSSPQDSLPDSPPPCDQSRLEPLLPSGVPPPPLCGPAACQAGPAHNQNPVLSKLLMADQDAPLDLTIKKPVAEPHEQDGVLDLSIKKNRYSNSRSNSFCLFPATSTLKGETQDVHVAKAKDLQSTSTLQQFMAKLCTNHQRQIVDAIGFLRAEVKGRASPDTPKNLNSPCVGPEKLRSESSSVLSESTPKAEVLEVCVSVPNTCEVKNIPRDTVALKTSVSSGPALEVLSPGSGNNQTVGSSLAQPVDVENNRQTDHAPLKMKIKASSAAAGKKLSCVLNATLSSNSDNFEDKQTKSHLFNKTDTHSARLSSVKRHNLLSITRQARQGEIFGFPKNTPTKVFQIRTSISPDSIKTARKTARTASEQIKDSASVEIVDPDFGLCDIVFINKPITECFKEKRRSMLPRRNARKSTRGHMYSDEIWELKTVRTLAGRGNCPSSMPELTTLVTPRQILSKPEGVPPVDMPFAGACTDAMSKQMPSNEPDDSVVPGAGDIVEVAAGKGDVIFEMSQTDQCLTGSPSLLKLQIDDEGIPLTKVTEQGTVSDEGTTKENTCRSPHEAGKDHFQVHGNVTQDILSCSVTDPQQLKSLQKDDLEPYVSKADLQVSSAQPLVSFAEPMGSLAEPPVSLAQSPVSLSQPPVSLAQPPTSSTDSPVSLAEPLVSSVQPQVTLDKPLVSSAELHCSFAEPLDSLSVPQVSLAEPQASLIKPESLLTEPCVLLVEPEVSSVENKLSSVEPQVSSAEVINNEPISQMNITASAVDQIEVVIEKDDEEQVKNAKHEEIKARTECDNIAGPVEELSGNQIDIESPETIRKAEPTETISNDGDKNQSTEPSEELKIAAIGSEKRKIKTRPPEHSEQKKRVIVGFVKSKPVSASDRSLRQRTSSQPLSSRKTSNKSNQNLPNISAGISVHEPTSESKETNKTPLEIQATELSSDAPTSPAAKLPSCEEMQLRKTVPKSQCSLPSDPPTDQPQITTPKRQLRSTSQMSLQTPAPAPSSNIVTSITSPMPSALILPPAGQLPPLLLPHPLKVSKSPLTRPTRPLVSEQIDQTEDSETFQVPNDDAQQTEVVSEDAQTNKPEDRLETKPKLRSGKFIADEKKQQRGIEETKPLENQPPIKSEMQSESVSLRSRRVLRKDASAGNVALMEKNDVTCVQESDDNPTTSMLDKPTRMPLRSETSKVEASHQAVTESLSADNKRLTLRSQRSTIQVTNASIDDAKQNNVSSPVKGTPERMPKIKHSASVTSVSQSSPFSIITPKPEPPKQTVNKFFETLTGEQSQHLIASLNNKYDKLLKGWVQMDKDGQPTTKYRNKSDRQAAIWKSKRRVRKTKTLEQQKYSPVQMLFMKGFNLNNICRWFLESTETQSLVIVKKVNTRLPSETQLCFHSSSSVSGPSQGIFPSLQAERLKKHLKKFAIASPVKSNPKSQKIIAKAFEQEPNAVKGKEKSEPSNTTSTQSKLNSTSKISAKKEESNKSSGKSKNPASARILRKYSNIRGKMQGQQTTRMKEASKMLKSKKIKATTVSKSPAKSNLKPPLKGRKSAIPVMRQMKESAAKLARRQMLARKKSTKHPVQKKAVKAQCSKPTKDRSNKNLPKRCSQRISSPKTSEQKPVSSPKGKVKKLTEADKANMEKCETSKKPQTSQRSVDEIKGSNVTAEPPQLCVEGKALASPEQVQTRSQRRTEAVTPPTGGPTNLSKKAPKSSKTPSPSVTRKVDEPKVTRSGASKRAQSSSLPRNAAKQASKKAQELLETPAKRARKK